MSIGRKNQKLRRLLAEARDLLVHSGGHVRNASTGEYPPCPGCDLEERIDKTLGTQLGRGSTDG